MSVLIAYTTVGTREDAQRIARALVERRLAACVQIGQIDSVYRWNGAVQQEPECRLVIKTTRARYAALELALRELHPYELPAIHALDPVHVLPAYADWVASEVA